MQNLDYAAVHAIAVRSLQQLDGDLCVEKRPLDEIEKEAHKHASVWFDVWTAINKPPQPPKGRTCTTDPEKP